MTLRMNGLEVLLDGLDIVEGSHKDGALWLVRDVTDAMERCAEAFEAERQLRIKEETAKCRLTSP